MNTKRIFVFLIILFSALGLHAQTKRAMNIEDLWAMKRIGSFDVSPDGEMIVFDVTKYSLKENKGDADIFIIGTDGKNLTPLKNSSSSEYSPKFSKDGKRVFYIRKGQIWSCNLKGKDEVKVTNFFSDITDFTLSNNNSKILFTSEVYPQCATAKCNKMRAKYFKEKESSGIIIKELMFRHWNRWHVYKRSHLFLFDLKTKKTLDVTLHNLSDTPPIDLGSNHDFTFSPDGKEIAFVNNPDRVIATSTNNEVYIIPVKNVKRTEVPRKQKISVSKGNDNEPVYSPDGKYIAFRSMKHPGFEADKSDLIIYDRKKGTLKNLTKDWKYSVGEILWSKDSKKIFVTTPYEINNAVFEIDVATGKRKILIAKHINNSLRLSGDGNTLFFRRQKNNLPYEIFALNLKNNSVRQITFLNKERLSHIQWGEFSTFYSKGAGNVPVQSILVKPPFFNKKKKYPLLFLIHGGPQGHWSDDFHYRWNLQLFASYGYVIVAPNPRGSVGYGQQFTNEISKDWGGKVYTDLMNALDYAIAKFDFVDSNNVFAAGASYGGYMINWIEGHTDRFNALVCHDGVYDLISMYGSTEELWFPEWEFGGTPWDNPELYNKWSPSNYVKNFKTPMLVIHGAHDYRVPETQAFELFTALQRRGVQSKLLYFPDETHFVTKPQNSKLWWTTIFEWFGRHFKR